MIDPGMVKLCGSARRYGSRIRRCRYNDALSHLSSRVVAGVPRLISRNSADACADTAYSIAADSTDTSRGATIGYRQARGCRSRNSACTTDNNGRRDAKAYGLAGLDGGGYT